jgi:hypothetical protein
MSLLLLPFLLAGSTAYAVSLQPLLRGDVNMVSVQPNPKSLKNGRTGLTRPRVGMAGRIVVVDVHCIDVPEAFGCGAVRGQHRVFHVGPAEIVAVLNSQRAQHRSLRCS